VHLLVVLVNHNIIFIKKSKVRIEHVTPKVRCRNVNNSDWILTLAAVVPFLGSNLQHVVCMTVPCWRRCHIFDLVFVRSPLSKNTSDFVFGHPPSHKDCDVTKASCLKHGSGDTRLTSHHTASHYLQGPKYNQDN